MRRFTRGGPKHPTNRAIEELGRAVRTYLTDVELRHENHESLQGGGELELRQPGPLLRQGRRPDFGADKESQEVSMLAPHLLQSALVHVDTLLMQQVLADPKWAGKLTDADRRGLSPLFWTHVNPYGRFELDVNSRLDLGLATPIPRQRTEKPQPAAAG
ncbi:Tn3 family transposase [Nonomuraea sp. bgisy101]|uniref:Tn3 family transposase n=1 Tax=Nonomuraea sp. bgisy101 TaxID=3413784 RepID=UPI003D703E42